MSHMDFSKWLNNEYIPRNPERRMFIKSVSSKAVKRSLSHAETAYKRFFDKGLKSGYPKYKRNQHKGSFYLIGAIKAERHRIQLPTLKWVKLKEKGYIPSDENYQNGFIEVSERTIITYKGKIKEYTVLFTDKGQKEFLPIIKELISKKEQA